MDFLQRLKEYMEGLPFTPSVVNIGAYESNGDDVAIRPSPANINERHLDKGKIYPFSFQVLVHHKNNLTAYEMIDQIMSSLDNLSSDAIISNDGSFALVSFECTTTPNYVQRTSHGVLWTAMFTTEIYILGG